MLPTRDLRVLHVSLNLEAGTPICPAINGSLQLGFRLSSQRCKHATCSVLCTRLLQNKKCTENSKLCSSVCSMTMLQGSAINQDGRSSSLTAPNGPSQNALITAAMSASELAPADVAAIAVHGTGTPLGDPIGAESSS